MCRKPHSMSDTISPIGGATGGSGNLSTSYNDPVVAGYRMTTFIKVVDIIRNLSFLIVQ
jgi:hypothetical protein